MSRRLVVIGGDAGGMSAASQARRLRAASELEIVVLEQGEQTSYSACGIPYWIGGRVVDIDRLIARAPEVFRRKQEIDVRLGAEVTGIDPANRSVRFRSGGEESDLGYDDLLIATGAEPDLPELPGIEARGVHTVQTLPDAEAIDASMATRPGRRRAVVVGGGYVGLEMAEALVDRGLDVTLVHSGPQPMNALDPDMGGRIRQALVEYGVTVRAPELATGIETDGSGWARRVVTDDGGYDADLVIIGVGVRPRSELARAARIAVGVTGGVRVDSGMRSVTHPGIWAAGDCIETWHRISHRPVAIALGTHANKQGRVAGTNIGGAAATFGGVLGTAITKIGETEVACTGLKEEAADEAGYDAVALVTESTTRAGYYPGAEPIAVKLVAERVSGRLLGAQIVGGPGSGKRIDVVATALWANLRVEDLAAADLSYAPPFGPTLDPVVIAARRLAERKA